MIKPSTLALTVFGGFVLAVLIFSSAYTISEVEQVIITEFGKPVGQPINADPAKSEAGLHFKIPFIQTVNRFEKRILEWDGPAMEMPTKDKLYVVVDNFARWRISDPRAYLEQLNNERTALSRLSTIIGNATMNVIASHDLIEVVRSDKARKLTVDPDLVEVNPNAASLAAIQRGRAVLDQEIFKIASSEVKRIGIELLDVRFKRINYNARVTEKIYDRMVSERQQIAERFRSEGAGEAAKISGRKEKDLREIESGAYRTVQELQGKADAEATEIYAKAYNTSPLAADFYQFLKTLETYKTTLGRDSTLILTTDSDFFKYLKNISPEPAEKAQRSHVRPPLPPAPAPSPSAPPVNPPQS
jgi:membrane protease subunit HflC